MNSKAKRYARIAWNYGAGVLFFCIFVVPHFVPAIGNHWVH